MPASAEIDRPVIVMRPINWSIKLPGRRREIVAYLPRLSLKSRDDYSAVCRMWPRIFDALNLTFDKVHPKGRHATDDDLLSMGKAAAKSINEILNKTMVQSVRLISSIDPEFRVTSTFPCRLIGAN